MENTEETYAAWRTAVSYSTATLALTMSLVSMTFIGAIVPTLKFSFNLYIIVLLVPDALLNLLEGITCIHEGRFEGSVPMDLCRARNFCVLFYYFGNIYMNAAVAKEVYALVLSSHQARRTPPPTARKVLGQAAAVYAFAGLMGAWFVLPVDWAILTIHNETYCTTKFGNRLIPEWPALAVALVPTALPFFYMGWVVWRIRRGRLLPLKGRTRALAMYFFRIVVTFVCFYGPMAILAFIKNAYPVESYGSVSYFLIMSVFSSITPIQNVVTIYFLLQKNDIRAAVTKLGRRVSSDLVRAGRRMSVANLPGRGRRPDEWEMDDVYEPRPGATPE